MAGCAFGGAAWRICTEQLVDRLFFRGIVAARRRAVQVNVVDLSRRDTGACQRACHRRPCTGSFGVWRGHVEGIAALADAEQDDGIVRQWALCALEERKPRAFADR